MNWRNKFLFLLLMLPLASGVAYAQFGDFDNMDPVKASQEVQRMVERYGGYKVTADKIIRTDGMKGDKIGRSAAQASADHLNKMYEKFVLNGPSGAAGGAQAGGVNQFAGMVDAVVSANQEKAAALPSLVPGMDQSLNKTFSKPPTTPNQSQRVKDPRSQFQNAKISDSKLMEMYKNNEKLTPDQQSRIIDILCK